MYEFAYLAPSSLADAAAALKAKGDAKIVAGGMTLIPTLKQRLAQPSDLVDLGRIQALSGIKQEGDGLVIGAMTTHAEVAHSSVVKSTIPALASLAEGIGDPQVRHRGTIGGSIANADPAADYPAGLLGLGAEVETDRRRIKADDFFTGMFETALEADEIVTAVRFPKPQKAAYVKFPNPASRYAIVGVFVAATAGGVRVAVTGAGPNAFRLSAFEAALTKSFTPAALDGVAVDGSSFNADIHADSDYRAHLVTVMAKRAVTACI